MQEIIEWAYNMGSELARVVAGASASGGVTAGGVSRGVGASRSLGANDGGSFNVERVLMWGAVGLAGWWLWRSLGRKGRRSRGRYW